MIRKADEVKPSNVSLPHLSRTGWQLLGELQLPGNSNNDDTIQAWLMEILGPLQLRMTFLSKILQSAKETAARIALSENTIKYETIHFHVFAPIHYMSGGQTWGFFRIEKVQAAKPSIALSAHAVEFYLYLEGQ